jgi:hypothetical protein
MRVEEVELDNRFGEQYAGRYVFQEITWAKRSRIIQKHTKYHPVTGQIASSDFVAIQAETIWASLREQPANKPVTLEKLLSEENGVPIELGEFFSRIANKLCSLASDEQHFLSEPSAEANPTQHSQSLGLPKNSGGPHCKSESSQPESSSNSSSS